MLKYFKIIRLEAIVIYLNKPKLCKKIKFDYSFMYLKVILFY